MKSRKTTPGILAISILVLFFFPGCGSRKQPETGAVENKPAAAPAAAAVERLPIIDAHIHAFHAWDSKSGPWPWPEWLPRDFLPAPKTDEALLRETLDKFKRFNIVKAVVSGGSLDQWQAAAPGLIVPGFMTGIAGTSPDQLRSLRSDFAAGRYAVIGEVLSQYHGLTPNDPQFEPFLALAEEFDKPMTVHMGLGAPGRAQFRMSLSNPLLFEDALVRHPKLRLCVCHAGWPLLEEMIALLYYYPQVYVDTAFIDWYLPRPEFQAYLRRLVEAGYGKRIMFGTDNLYWPESIRLAVESIASADFLTPEQKRDIFYNNAARFFRLAEAGPGGSSGAVRTGHKPNGE